MTPCDPRVRIIARAIGYPSEWYEFHGSHHRCSQEYQRYAERRAVDRYKAIEEAVRVIEALADHDEGDTT